MSRSTQQTRVAEHRDSTGDGPEEVRAVRWRSPRAWWARARLAGDEGMATAEYAIATVAAAGFAGLLILVLRSDEVRGMLVAIVRGALSV